MTESSRRNFLKYAGAGAAVAGVAAVTPAVLAKDDKNLTGTNEDTSIPGSTPGSFMAYVNDVHSGEVTMLLEGHEIVVKDATLVARLARAVHENS